MQVTSAAVLWVCKDHGFVMHLRQHSMVLFPPSSSYIIRVPLLQYSFSFGGADVTVPLTKY